MKKYQRVGLLTLAFLVALGGIYDIAHKTAGAPSADQAVKTQVEDRKVSQVNSDTTSTKPRPILRDKYSELKSRADADDPIAAAELFHDLMNCSFAAAMKKAMPPKALAELNRDSSGDSVEQLEAHERELGNIQRTLDFVRDQETRCADFENPPPDSVMPSMLKAAQLGDQLATRCYLDGSFLVTSNLISHPEWLEDYKQNALEIAQRGMERGDWRVVGLMQRAQLGPFKFELLGQIDSNDPTAEYRYLKLERLGSTGDFGTSLDPMMATSAQRLSPDQIAQADAWSQRMYSNYFNGSSSNVIDKAPGVCNPDL